MSCGPSCSSGSPKTPSSRSHGRSSRHKLDTPSSAGGNSPYVYDGSLPTLSYYSGPSSFYDSTRSNASIPETPRTPPAMLTPSVAAPCATNLAEQFRKMDFDDSDYFHSYEDMSWEDPSKNDDSCGSSFLARPQASRDTMDYSLDTPGDEHEYMYDTYGSDYEDNGYEYSATPYSAQSYQSTPARARLPPFKSKTVCPGASGGARASPQAISFAGKGQKDASGMARSKFEPWVEKNTSWKKTDETSIWGPHMEYDEPDFDYSDPQRRKQYGFDPYVHTYGIKHLGDPYKHFEPHSASTPKPPFTPYKYFEPPEASSPLHMENYMRYQPSVREPSFLNAASPCARSPSQRVRKHKNLTPDVAAYDSATTEGIKHVLGEMEHDELSRIKKDLKDFQKARRRLIFDATHIRPLIQ